MPTSKTTKTNEEKKEEKKEEKEPIQNKYYRFTPKEALEYAGKDSQTILKDLFFKNRYKFADEVLNTVKLPVRLKYNMKGELVPSKTKEETKGGYTDEFYVKGWNGMQKHLQSGGSRNFYASSFKKKICTAIKITTEQQKLIDEYIVKHPETKTKFDSIKNLHQFLMLRKSLGKTAIHADIREEKFDFVPKELKPLRPTKQDIAEQIEQTKKNVAKRQEEPIKILEGQKVLFQILGALKTLNKGNIGHVYCAVLLATGLRPSDVFLCNYVIKDESKYLFSVNHIAKKRLEENKQQMYDKPVLANTTILKNAWDWLRLQFKCPPDMDADTFNSTYETKVNGYTHDIAKEFKLPFNTAHEYRRIYSIMAYNILAREDFTQVKFIEMALSHDDIDLTQNYSSAIISNIRYVWTGDDKIDDEHLKEMDLSNPMLKLAQNAIPLQSVVSAEQTQILKEILQAQKQSQQLLAFIIEKITGHKYQSLYNAQQTQLATKTT